jgi:hypothetical protein
MCFSLQKLDIFHRAMDDFQGKLLSAEREKARWQSVEDIFTVSLQDEIDHVKVRIRTIRWTVNSINMKGGINQLCHVIPSLYLLRMVLSWMKAYRD